MTVASLTFEAFVSGQCPAVRGRGRARVRPVPEGKDYCLVDQRGKRLGTVRAARVRPELGRNAPTLLLDREGGR
jgi:hypothetical protein